MSTTNANTQHSSTKQEPCGGNTLQSFIKREHDPNENDELIENGDDDDGSNEDGSYRPRPQLPLPQVNLRSLADLMKGLEDGIIDVNPEYQREVVWTGDGVLTLLP
ncbi:hypothetical protein NX059_008396 [Plenodomus lindquistii]|nr:hypothetical protein NX059_008396 [Plenodomus lindquistii]